MAQTSRVVIIHGSYGNPAENWFPWLAEEVRRRGHAAVVPAFPTPEGQTLNAWREMFFREVGPVSPAMILVGHSVGAGFILHLLQEASSPVRGTLLASGFIGSLNRPEFDSINETFVMGEFDWQRIRGNAGTVHVYHSDNDPYVALDKGRELAAKLGVGLAIVPGGGHLNAAAGYTQFPDLLKALEEIIGTR